MFIRHDDDEWLAKSICDDAKESSVMEGNASSDVEEKDEEVTENDLTATANTHQNFRDRFLRNYADFLYEFR